MSISLATKGILSSGNFGSNLIVTKYLPYVIEVEAEMDVVEIMSELISETVSITNSGVITIEIEIDEDTILAEELSIDVFVESNEIEVEVNPCQA